MGRTNLKKFITVFLSSFFITLGIFLIYQVISPEIIFRLNKPDQEKIIQSLKTYDSHLQNNTKPENNNIKTEEAEIKENRLIIPSIGFDAEIGLDEKYLNEAIGGWVQKTDKENMPLFIAVHRFGWSGINPEEKMRKTLYHVYKLKGGDKVILLWEGRKYEYEVKEVMEGVNNPVAGEKEIILYTCRWWKSEDRVFVGLGRMNL